ncbi:sensor histidine kinase [Anaerolinea thermophila]|uniref:histidine kinase n=1 Tax=Anaerolinea thermophila (strain DSM 14523 / JCM 11388 / NBRC 100420 / UNI-1) TaxID=926569 RepID=E8N697_ANATU|nr:ATP-binding protein [Anaerolinea thermophila]BAJ63961.1 two-component sensor histidine kinase [Anaerolinea thermophila UNI-1]
MNSTSKGIRWFILFYLFLYALWIFFPAGHPSERALGGGLALWFSGTVATVTALYTRHHLPSGSNRRLWTWISVGLGLWWTGDFFLIISSTRSPLFSSLREIVFTVGAGLILAGILQSPRKTLPSVSKLRLWMDVTINASAVVILSWLILLKPVMQVLTVTGTGSFAILYPSMDLVLLLVLILIFQTSEVESISQSLGWIGAGLLAYTMSDLAYVYLANSNAYIPGSPVDLGWTLGDGFFILSSWVQMQTKPDEIPRFPRVLRFLIQRIRNYLPLVNVIVLGWYTLLLWQFSGKSEPLGLWGTVFLGLVLIARQGIMTGEVEYQQYANLVNHIAEPTFICNATGHLRLANPAFLELIGVDSPEKITGLPLQQIFRPSAGVTLWIKEGLSSGWTGEVEVQRLSNGLSLPVMLALRPLVPGKTIAGTAHDLSQIKQQQIALQKAYEEIAHAHAELSRMNAELEQRVAEKTASLSEAYQQLERQNIALKNLDRLKSDFVSLVSHELRAPLTNISGGIELLLLRSKRLPRDATQTLQLVQSEILRLTRFVESILDLSALDAGKMPLFLAPISVHSVIEVVKRQFSHTPNAGRIRWEIPDKFPDLLADEQALTSVLFHLLDNAMKYAPEGEIVVKAWSKEDKGFLEIRDHGQGIPEEDLPLLFTQFFRSRMSDSQTIYGHGLGLYMVQRLLEAMNGTIMVRNLPEGGACFTCSLPIVQMEAGEDHEAESLDRG